MALATGSRVGAYEITGLLGAGGMGEVYRARDSRLKREVAIKVLPPEVATDQERLARFQREAEVLASLNHPNIAQIYGIEDGALVMELVDGEDLSRLISETGSREAGTGLPIEEALAIAKQIADALEAAHDAGIIHRDLKPANIKVRADGTVKVLDFGLAKALEPGSGHREPAAGDAVANSPTITSPAMTLRGVILGTAAYMAPEQAKGKVVDRRADIWAFGCVLYEMLSGRKAFSGDDITDTLTSVMRDTPDWQALPSVTAPSIRTLIRRCLEKDPRKRPPHIGIARIEIEEAIAGAADLVRGAEPPSLRPPRTRVVQWTAVITATVLAIVAAGWAMRRPLPDPARSTYVAATLAVGTPHLATITDRFAVAPDGSAIVIVGPGNGGLLLRRPGELTATPIAGAPASAFSPVFSPDSRWIAFSSGDALMKIPVAGGTPVTLVRTDDYFINLTWGADDRIRYPSRDNVVIRSVSANGGAVDTIEFGAKTWVNRADWLPGGRLLVSAIAGGQRTIGVREADGRLRTLVNGWDGRLTPTGHLLFTQAEGATWSLAAVPIDMSSASLAGEVEVVGRDVAVHYATPAGGTSTGDLFYLSGAAKAERRLVTIDRSGAEREVALPAAAWVYLRVADNGRQVALTRWDSGSRSIWMLTLGTGALTRLTYGDDTFYPVWMPDGRRLLLTRFPMDRELADTSMWMVAADGAGRLEPIGLQRGGYPTGTSADGRLLYYRFETDTVQTDIFQLPLDARDSRPAPVVVTPADEADALPSPDGRWLAYSTQASGQHEVRVLDLEDRTISTQVSAQGGVPIRWSPSSTQLYYLDGKAVSAIAVGRGGPVLASKRVAFPLPPDIHGPPDVVPDGDHAVVIRGGPIYQDLIVMQNALRKRR